MDKLFTVSFRGNLVQLDKHVLQSLPTSSKFTDLVERQHNIGLCQMLQDSRNDLLIYVNRSSSLFNHILDYIEHGELHYPRHVCPIIIAKELEFWGYSEKDLGSCCLDRILKGKEKDRKFRTISEEWMNCSNTTSSCLFVCPNNIKKKASDKDKMNQSDELLEHHPIEVNVTRQGVDAVKEDKTESGIVSKPHGLLMQKLSELLVNPLDSLPGKIWMAVIISVVTMSMFTLMLECEPRIRYPSFEEVMQTTNLTYGEGQYNYYFNNSVPGLWVVFLDFGCAFILTLDFIGRCLVSERRCLFLIHPYNILDILAIFPVWVLFILALFASIQKWSVEDWEFLDRHVHASMILAILHLFRLFRFRLILLHFKPLRMISLAYKYSMKELFLLSIILTMGSIVYGVLLFFTEIHINPVDSFPSGIHAQWWAFVTMTTVGYGDFVPKTDIGYLLGVSCSLFGIVIVAMTTSIIITNFMQVYKNVETVERKNKYFASLQFNAKTETNM